MQSRRDAKAAKRLLRKLLKKQGRAPRVLVTFTRNEAGEPAPLPPEERSDPAMAPVIHHHITQAVQFALDGHGPLPTGKLRARQPHAVLRERSAAAV